MSGGRKICMTDSIGMMLFSIPDGGIVCFMGTGRIILPSATIWMNPMQRLTV